MKKLSLKSLSVFISVLFLLLAVLTINKSSNVLTKASEQKLDTVMVEQVVVHEPKVLYGMVVDDYLLIEDKIKRNQLLGDILTEYNVPATLINQLSSISKQIFDVRKIAPDKKYTLICNQDSLKSLKALVYEPNPIEYVVLKFGDSLSVDLCKREVVTVEKSISGIIRSNLSETIEEMGISHELTNKFVDIFGWQVDFQRLQKGDKFKLIYEENQVEGQSVGSTTPASHTATSRCSKWARPSSTASMRST
jgi:hypothetical protein